MVVLSTVLFRPVQAVSRGPQGPSAVLVVGVKWTGQVGLFRYIQAFDFVRRVRARF